MVKGSKLTPARRVLIVDDHELMRHGLRDLVQTQSEWEVCGEASDENEGYKMFRELAPDLVIIDLVLQNSSGLDLIKRIKQINPAARTLVLSMHNEKLYAERALRAGADGFVNKQQPSHDVIEAIRTILDGGLYVSEEISRALLKRVVHAKPEQEASPLEQLSDRELEVLRLIGQGRTTKQIAGLLHLSSNTIGTYRERLKEKLNVRTSAELSVVAINLLMEQG